MSEGVPPDRLRASDSDRERVLEVLSAALADGRLDPEEHGERADRAVAARTLGDLVPITTDLLPSGEQPIQLRSEPILAVFRGETRSGRWVVPARPTALAVFGTVELDLREALFTRRHVRLNASSLFGRVLVEVPDDVEVRVRGRAFLGRRRATARPSRIADPPVLELEGLTILGSLRVRAPKRRRLWSRRRNRPELR